jgi:hypothetical protein
MAALATSTVVSTGHVGKVFAQNQSMISNLTTTTNQTLTNQTAPQMANEKATNQTLTGKLTTSDVEDIRKSLEDVRKSIAYGKSVNALKTINEIDDKLLVSMGDNPPSMLEKSTATNGNGNGN